MLAEVVVEPSLLTSFGIIFSKKIMSKSVDVILIFDSFASISMFDKIGSVVFF